MAGEDGEKVTPAASAAAVRIPSTELVLAGSGAGAAATAAAAIEGATGAAAKPAPLGEKDLKAVAYGMALQTIAGSKGASNIARKRWDKLTHLLSTVDHLCEQVQHHEFPHVAEEGEAEEKLAEVGVE